LRYAIAGAVGLVAAGLGVLLLVVLTAAGRTERPRLAMVMPTPSSGSATTPPSTAAVPSPSRSASARPSPSPSRPTLSGWPDAAHTGVPATVRLRSSGSVAVTRNGTVIDGLDVHGTIDVQANNVVIRNTRVTNSATANWGIIQRDGYGGLVVQDSQLRGNGSQEMQQAILNFGGDLTVRRTDISQVSDGIATVQGLIEDSYLHDPKVFEGDHVDLIQATSGPPPGKSLAIRHNTIVNTAGQTSAVGLFQDFGLAHDTLLADNYLAGGAYTIYGGAGSKGASRNIRVEHNTFGRDVFPKSGYYGPVAYFATGDPGNTWVGNVWAKTGAPVLP
jgi:hypothetical protein